MKRGFEFVTEEKIKGVGENLLPLRGTRTSAGYDFFATEDMAILPGQKLTIWTNVKAKMPDGEVLLMDIRSSKAINDDLMIANIVPVIDSDYYGNIKNDGNIGICIKNTKPTMELKGYSKFTFGGGKDVEDIDIVVPNIESLMEINTVHIKKGEGVAQGLFFEFKESENCNSEVIRTGGTGSTDKK